MTCLPADYFFSALSLPQEPSFLSLPQEPSFLSLPQEPSFFLSLPQEPSLCAFLSLLPQEPLPQEPSLALSALGFSPALPSSLASFDPQSPAWVKAASAPKDWTGVAPTVGEPPAMSEPAVNRVATPINFVIMNPPCGRGRSWGRTAAPFLKQDEVWPDESVQSQAAVVKPFGAGLSAIVTFFYLYGSIPGDRTWQR